MLADTARIQLLLGLAWLLLTMLTRRGKWAFFSSQFILAGIMVIIAMMVALISHGSTLWGH